MEGDGVVEVKSVLYYAVYASGRRCLVTLEDLQKYGDQWCSEGLTFETDVIRQDVPTYGKMNLVGY